MSCACEQRKMACELDRVRRLAKGLARIEGEAVAIYADGAGGYGFDRASAADGKDVIEYISPY